MKQFEYKVIAIPTRLPITNKQYDEVALDFQQQFNALGLEGWELVDRADGFFFFKREIEQEVK
ncbi:MAG: DUF4177 domain-containing protein [Oscillospiraceae bacterium]|nr:DUF4177 domain-containing protein [Oscillospiraceae bacterium]